MTLSPELRAQLRAVGFEVAQHAHQPEPDEWWAGIADPKSELGGGDCGPYESAETALVRGVAWLVGLLRETQDERDEYAAEAHQLRTALAAAQAELHAERAATQRRRHSSDDPTPIAAPRQAYGVYAPVPDTLTADLMWALLARAGLYVAKESGAWRWTLNPPSRGGYRVVTTDEPVWYGPYESAGAALSAALTAAIGYADEDEEKL